MHVTPRQREVIGELITNGSSNKMIAFKLGIAEGTVKAHLRSVMRKFKVHNRVQLVVRMGSSHPQPQASMPRDVGCW